MKRAAGRERIVGFLQERAFLVDLENAERNAGENVIALRDAAALQFLGETGGVAIDHMDARIVGELPFEIARERGIQFEEKQLRIRPHPAAQSRANGRLRPGRTRRSRGLAEIDLARDSFDERLGAGDDRSDLKRPL